MTLLIKLTKTLLMYVVITCMNNEEGTRHHITLVEFSWVGAV